MKLKIKNITKSFGDKQVLKNINFSAVSGKALGILGRNGAGKTTLIRIIMDIFNADKGEILIDGNPINPNKIKLGYLPEERGLYPQVVVISQLVYLGMLQGMTKNDAIKSAEYWLDKLQMNEYKKSKLGKLSKGNQQKIQLIVSLIANPDIIILDELFSGLDPVNAFILRDTVKELVQNNKILLFSSHQMNYVEEFCNDICILNDGNIVVDDTITNLKRNYPRDKIILKSSELSKIKENLTEYSEIIENNLVINLKSPDDKHPLFTKILQMNIDIDEMKIYEPSLNDIFIQYTKEAE